MFKIEKELDKGLHATLQLDPFPGCSVKQQLTLATNDFNSHLNMLSSQHYGGICLPPAAAKALRDLLIKCYPIEQTSTADIDSALRDIELRLNALENENVELLQRIEEVEAFEMDLKDKFASLADLGV